MRVPNLLLLFASLFLLPGCSGEAESAKDATANKTDTNRSAAEENSDDPSANDEADEVEDDAYELKVFAEAGEVQQPNGLLVREGKLLVASSRKLVALDLVRTEQEDVTGSIGDLDGIESDGGDGYFVSDWNAGKVFHVHGGGHAHEILSLQKGTADLAYLPEKGLLIVPEMLENKVTALDLSDPEATHSDDGPPVVWTVTDGIQMPESVYYDADSGFLFVSQIGGGGPAGKDGDGWISKLSTDGKVVEDKWVTGLSAPKGLRSYQGTLWVSDIDRLVAIDIEKGEVLKEVPVPDARFLNDVACDGEGTVYVSDTQASKIYKYQPKR